jgi:hypothetical protein
MHRPVYDTVIFGGGPVGLTTALIAARYGTVLVVLANHGPAAHASRIDCVPVALLALFVELGLHPEELGADTVHDHRLVAWERDTPEPIRGAGTVHVQRPLLENMLLARVQAHRAITVAHGMSIDRLPPSGRILDATGRRALTADRRRTSPNPALLRGIVIRGSFSRAQQSFRLAALPTGYVYRLGIADALMVGLIQGREQWRETAQPFTEKLRLAGATWVLAGVNCDRAERSIGGAAGVQWSIGRRTALRIGDSALARDALSSQGIANGISAALRLFDHPDPEEFHGSRLHAERLTHLATLTGLADSCVYRHSPFWRHYRLFLRDALSPARATLGATIE